MNLGFLIGVVLAFPGPHWMKKLGFSRIARHKALPFQHQGLAWSGETPRTEQAEEENTLFRGFYYSQTFLPERVVEGSTIEYNRNSLPRDEF